MLSDCGPRWSSLCQMSEAPQRQPLGVVFHLCCCGADMQIRCNECSLCGSRGDELRNFKWRKGRWRKKVRCWQLCHIAKHTNLRGLGERYVRSDRMWGNALLLKLNVYSPALHVVPEFHSTFHIWTTCQCSEFGCKSWLLKINCFCPQHELPNSHY